MTREEATKRMKGLKARCERLIVSSDRGPEEWKKDAEAVDLALAALRPVSREMVEKMRGKWKRDKWPSGTHRIICNRCGEWNGKITNFCPHCGAPMTDEAVQMVMERLERMKDVGRA